MHPRSSRPWYREREKGNGKWENAGFTDVSRLQSKVHNQQMQNIKGESNSH